MYFSNFTPKKLVNPKDNKTNKETTCCGEERSCYLLQIF